VLFSQGSVVNMSEIDITLVEKWPTTVGVNAL